MICRRLQQISSSSLSHNVWYCKNCHTSQTVWWMLQIQLLLQLMKLLKQQIDQGQLANDRRNLASSGHYQNMFQPITDCVTFKQKTKMISVIIAEKSTRCSELDQNFTASASISCRTSASSISLISKLVPLSSSLAFCVLGFARHLCHYLEMVQQQRMASRFLSTSLQKEMIFPPQTGGNSLFFFADSYGMLLYLGIGHD